MTPTTVSLSLIGAVGAALLVIAISATELWLG